MFKHAKSLFRRQPWPQLKFPTSRFDIVSDAVLFEEEQLEGFQRGVYYPVNIGDLFASNYQVVGKLGFGVTSTVWLARDLQQVAFGNCAIYTNSNQSPCLYNAESFHKRGNG